MFKQNVGQTDRVIRILLGLALLTLTVVGEGTLRWAGLIGIVPLATAALGSCPVYTLLGLSTCPMKRAS